MNGEAFLIKAFNDARNTLGVDTFGDIPPVRPSEFITVERVGGRRERVQQSLLLAVQCWAPTRAKAAKLADKVEAFIDELRLSSEVALAEVESVYNFPDSESGQARYQLTVRCVLHL